MSSPAPDSRSRLKREDRRAQLLDAAADLVVERGADAVTMERLAEWAGVSKALPYSHFDNSDHVLVELYEQFVGRLGRRVLAALRDARPDDDKVRLVVRTHLDAVRDFGAILGPLTAPGSRASQLAEGGAGRDRGPVFVTELMVNHFDVTPGRARAAAPIVLAALTGAVNAWSTRAGSRRDIENITVDVVRAAIGHTS